MSVRATLDLTALARAALVTTSAAACTNVAAQPAHFPSKPIRLIVPYSPGTGADIAARALGPRLADEIEILRRAVVGPMRDQRVEPAIRLRRADGGQRSEKHEQHGGSTERFFLRAMQ